MWVFLNDAFLSIVQPAERDIPKSIKGEARKDVLMVRARKEGDLERVFPGAKVFRWKGRDYPLRTFVKRGEVAAAMAVAVDGLHYSNFKSSVKDGERHDAYMGVWSVMHRFQHGGFAPRPFGKAGQRDFAWGTGDREAEVSAFLDGPDNGGWERESPAFFEGKCTSAGCSIMDPCAKCVSAVLANDLDDDLDRADQRHHAIVDDDDYGPFDDRDDAGALGELRIPPPIRASG